MPFARFTKTEIAALQAEGWQIKTHFDDMSPRMLVHPHVGLSLSAAINNNEPAFCARPTSLAMPWWPVQVGQAIYAPTLASLLVTLRQCSDTWAQGVIDSAAITRAALLGAQTCARGCGRPVAAGDHRPTADSPLKNYCFRCPQVARRRVKLRGGDPHDIETLMAELRRPGTRGVLPGTNPRDRKEGTCS